MLAPGGHTQAPFTHDAWAIVPSPLQHPCGTGGHWLHDSVDTVPAGHVHARSTQIADFESGDPQNGTHSNVTMPAQKAPLSPASNTPPSGAPTPQPAVTFTDDPFRPCTTSHVAGQRPTIVVFAPSST